MACGAATAHPPAIAGHDHAAMTANPALAAATGVNEADAEFMTGMIPHHAQAVIMAGWAPSHGARPDVAVLCERIVVAQRDEIGMMQGWLRDRGQEVPDATSTRHKMKMNGEKIGRAHV